MTKEAVANWLRIVLLLLFLSPVLVQAQTPPPSVLPLSGYCINGSKPSITSGLPSTNFNQNLIPKCTVAVFLTGTTTLATIYADPNQTPLTNPFTANQDGSWKFYVTPATPGETYDVTLSGGTAPNTYSPSRTLAGMYSPLNRAGDQATGPLYFMNTGYAPDGLIDLRSKQCGAVGNFVSLTPTATITLATPTTLTLSSAILTPAVTGQTVVVHGAGASGGPLISTITYVSPNSATLTTAAQTAVSNAFLGMGTDDSTAVQRCTTAAGQQSKGVKVSTSATPNGCYLVTKSIDAGMLGGFYYVGDSPTWGFGRSTICHALTEPYPVLDFTGSSRSGLNNVNVGAVGGDPSNSLATFGYLQAPAVGGNSPLVARLLGSTIQAGNTPGSGACGIAGGFDLIALVNTQCSSNYVGAVLGNGFGTTTPTSKFHTIGPGYGATLIQIMNSSIMGSLDSPLELEGSSAWDVGSNTYVTTVKPINNTGTWSNGAIIRVDQPGNYEQNRLTMHALRTENQAGWPGMTSLMLNAYGLKECSIEASLNSNPNGYAIGGGPNAQIGFCSINVDTNNSTAFNLPGGMINSTVRLSYGEGSFGTIGPGGQGFTGNSIYSWFTFAQVVAGLSPVHQSNMICTVASGGGACQWDGGFQMTGGLITGGDITTAGGLSTVGNVLIAGVVGAGMMSNLVRNSYDLSQPNWVVTTGTCTVASGCMTLNQPDGFGTNTAVEITTTAPVTFEDTNTANPLNSAYTYLACAHLKGATGTETVAVNAFELGIAFNLTPTWAWYCSRDSRSINYQAVFNLGVNAAAGEKIWVDAMLTVFYDTTFRGNSVPWTGATPAYYPTGAVAQSTGIPAVVAGNSVLSASH